MRNTNDAIKWYKEHNTFPANLDFDPDGMCLKIVRSARNIPAVYPSALSAQDATPKEHRVHDVSKLKRGMVLYYDDPRDSNPFGHIVTMVGRVKDADPTKLSDILVRTNSVKANRIVVVRGDYFPRYWGDQFQFGATWLNGQELLGFTKPKPTTEESKPKPKAKKPLGKSSPSLEHAVEDIENSIRYHKKAGHTRLVKALRRDRDALEATIKKFGGK